MNIKSKIINTFLNNRNAKYIDINSKYHYSISSGITLLELNNIISDILNCIPDKILNIEIKNKDNQLLKLIKGE